MEGVKLMKKKKNVRLLAPGIAVSNDTRETGLNNNDLIVGSSGSGKSGGYVFQALFNPTGSYIVSDTKGRLYNLFSAHLEKLGYIVKLIDFVNPDNSQPFNPLSGIIKDGQIREKEIKKIATSLVPNIDDKDPYWQEAARRYIAMLISYVIETLPEEEHTISSVVRLHQCFEKQGEELFLAVGIKNPESLAYRKYLEFAALKNSERTYACVVDVASQGLEPFEYKEYANIFSNPDSIDIACCGKKKTVILVNSSDNDSSFHILSNLFFKQALQQLIEVADSNPNGRLSVPVSLIMDDFAAGPRIDDFENIVSVIRSRDISVSIILQSLSQLYDRYGYYKAHTIINNCDHILFLSGHDKDTVEFMSEHINMPPNKVISKPRSKAILITDGKCAEFVETFTPFPEDLMNVLNSGKDNENSTDNADMEK